MNSVLARGACLAALAAALACPAALMADTVVVGTLPYTGVTVTGIRNDEVTFSANGREIAKPLAQVTRLTIDTEPAFNAAEEAFAAQDWDKAMAGYERTVRTTLKSWLKDWCSLRLVEAANKGVRLDLAVTGFVSLAERSPESAARLKLAMPKPDSTYLPEAITAVDAAIGRAKRNETKEVLLRLLGDLYAARNDAKGAADAAARLVEIQAAINPNSPAAQRAAILQKLRGLHVALEAKDYDKVIAVVEKDSAGIVEAADQADALMCLAEARAGKAGGSGDKNTWKEVALAYMRVVAHAPAGTPQAAEALLKTAAIHQAHLDEKNTAIQIYKQVIEEYKGQEPARSAEAELRKLQ
jgi:hypothetical protein